ncbi:MAG: Zn-dependent protease [Bacillales bacterium]|nr:Zn-dependent protease [Bacillales bacterium]
MFLNARGLVNMQEFAEKILDLKERNVWKVVELFYKRLQKQWNGPEVPVVILPLSNSKKRIGDLVNGLAFQSVMILLVDPNYSTKKLQSLVIHEYNHVVRLMHFPLDERNSTFFETCIMEGLAQFAVEEIVGSKYNIDWSLIYGNKDIHNLYNKYLKNNKEIKKLSIEHEKLLYGNKHIPENFGYFIGYTIVKEFSIAKKLSADQLLEVPFEEYDDFSNSLFRKA